MSKKKFITIGTSLAALAFITIVAGKPVFANESSPKDKHVQNIRRTGSREKITQGLTKTTKALNRRHDKLTQRIINQKKNDIDTKVAQDAVDSLRAHIDKIEALLVNPDLSTPASIHSLRTKVRELHKQAHEDITIANRALSMRKST